MPLVQYYKYERVLKARRKRKPEWQTELPPDTPEGREAYAIAAKYENRFKLAWTRMLKNLLTRKIRVDFNAAWREGSVDTVMNTFPFFGSDLKPEVWEKYGEDMARVYGEVIQESGDASTEELNHKFRKNMKFTLVEKAELITPPNVYSQKWIRERVLELVEQGITIEQRKVVADLIADGFERGLRAEEAYAAIQKNIGLTDREYNAVLKRRDLHVEAGLPEVEVERLTDVYRTKLLASRAERIARTETMMAQAQGRRASWQMAQDAQILPKVERVWVAVPGACKYCQSLDGTTAEVNGGYVGELATVSGPPLHPACGCTEILRRA